MPAQANGAAVDLPIVGLKDLQIAYSSGRVTPTGLIEHIYPKLQATKYVFITIAELQTLLQRCRELEQLPEGQRGRLWGVPFAVKDNIDVADYPTTVACPAFAYQPTKSAPAVEALLREGGIMVGKTNLDQFATGLVGTRTPYGTPTNTFDDRFVPGGSSSGSAVLVGSGLVTFSLGTDTAGSGRVPAQFNGCVGIKPTKGTISTTGVVPACATLDCVSCFAGTIEDAAVAVQVMQSAGAHGDPRWRAWPAHSYSSQKATSDVPAASSLTNGHAQNGHAHRHFRFGVPDERFLDFSGPAGDDNAASCRKLFAEAAQGMEALGGEKVLIDLTPFATVASMLYEDAFLAERYSALRSFLEGGKGMPTAEALKKDNRMERVLAAIFSGGLKWTAADLYDAQSKLARLTAQARVELEKVDFLMVPTALHHYTVPEIEEVEKSSDSPAWYFNAKLGRFTNFVNLMDMCGVSIPSGLLHHHNLGDAATGVDGKQQDPWVEKRAHLLAETGNPTPVLPFGVTLLAPAWQDETLWKHASEFHKATGFGCGPQGHGVQPYRSVTAAK